MKSSLHLANAAAASQQSERLPLTSLLALAMTAFITIVTEALPAG